MARRQNRKEFYFKHILNLVKSQEPLSDEILRRSRIVSDLQNKMERIIFNNEEYYSQLDELNKKNNEKFKKNKSKKSIIPTQINAILNNNYYLDKIRSKLVSESRNSTYLFSKENNTDKNQSKTFEKNKILLKKIKPSLFNNKEKRNINSINQLKTNSSNLTEVSVNKNIFKNKRIIRKAISSSILKGKIGSFDRNNNKFQFNSFNSSNNNDLSNIKIFPYERNTTFITGYNDRKENKNLSVKKSSKLSRNLLFFSKNNLSASKINTYNNYNDIFSGKAESNKRNHNFSNSLSRVNKIKLLKKNNDKNPNNLKKVTNKFKNYFNNKVEILNRMVHKRNNKLMQLIDSNNQEINNTKGIITKQNDELDIRKDILDEDGKNYLNNKKEEKKEILTESNNYKINLSNEDQIQSFDLLKKNINKISASEALKLIEKCIGKKQKEKVDFEQLLKDYNDKRKQRELLHIIEIRKKAEDNYQKMIKMKYNV